MTVKDIGIQFTACTAKYKNQYVVKSEFMHGDDDFTEYRETVFPAQHKDWAVDFLNWLKTTNAAIHKGGPEDLDGDCRFNTWAESPDFQIGLDGWPIDSNTSCEACYIGSEIDFYNADGQRFNAFAIE